MGMMPDNTQRGFPIARASRRSVVGTRFNPDMLATVREARGKTQTELAAALQVSQALVGKWEADLAVPSDKQVSALAEALNVQSNLFMVDRPRGLSSMSDFYHRAFAKAKRSDVKMIHARCSLMDLQVDRLLNIGKVPDDRIPSIDPDNHAGNVERVAMMARTYMGIGSGPIDNLVEVLERCGSIVLDRELEVDDVDALCRWMPELPKLFFVNGKRPPDRIRFNLAHELGHTVMHFDKDVEPKLAELQANRFAAAFLMPAQDIRRDLRGPITLTELSSLKRKWRVSMAALAMRARHLEAIDEKRYASICVQMSRNGWRKTEPVALAPEPPTAFKRLLRDHIAAGYKPEELADLLFVDVRHVHAMLEDQTAMAWGDTDPSVWQRNGVRLRLTQ
jgi:Zn-dependent peptidase ImmA (M78 family)